MVKTECDFAGKGVIGESPDRSSDILPKDTVMRQECQIRILYYRFIDGSRCGQEAPNEHHVNLTMGLFGSCFRNRAKGTDSDS